MAAEAATFANKRGIDFDLFMVPPSSDDQVFFNTMATEAAASAKKRGIEYGIFADNDLASPSIFPWIPESVYGGSNRPKDDFLPTPGQTALHPSQAYNFFVPEMTLAFAAYHKKCVKKIVPDAVEEKTVDEAAVANDDSPTRKEQDSLARKAYSQSIATAREQTSVTSEKVIAGESVPTGLQATSS